MKSTTRLLSLLAAVFTISSALAGGIRYAPTGWGLEGSDLGLTGMFSASGIAVDSQGNLLVAGNGGTGANPTGIVVKVSPAGKVLWYQSIIQPGALGASANAVACDASDNVYVTGGLVTGTSGEAIVAKYSSAGGAALWTLTTTGGGPGGLGTGVGGNAIAVDSSGVYAGGMWGNPTRDWLAKITTAGAWVSAGSPVGQMGLTVSSIALDASSNVYASFRDPDAPVFAQAPMALAMSSAGAVLWTRTNSSWSYTGCNGSSQGAPGTIVRVRIAADGKIWALSGSGNVYILNASTGAITGGMLVNIRAATFGQTMTDFAFWPAGMAVFAATGVVLGRTAACPGPEDGWEATDFSPVASAFSPTALAVGANGDIYATGSGSVGVLALRDVLSAPNSVKAGTLEIRNNVINLGENQPGGQDYAHEAHIFVRAGSGGSGSVKVSVYGPSGRLLGALADITVGSDGVGTLSFDGVVEGKRLSTGMYYIVASGAGVADRKPIMILGRKQ